jgi:hypothetical protein
MAVEIQEYDQDQILLMEEACISVNKKDQILGSITKKDSKIFCV